MKGRAKWAKKRENQLYSHKINMTIIGNVEMEQHITENLEKIIKKYFLLPDEDIIFDIEEINTYYKPKSNED